MLTEPLGEGGLSGNIFQGPAAFQFGDHSAQHNHFHPRQRAPVSWPHQLGVLPRPADSFQQRGDEARLAEAMGGGTAVLSGTGGVGKPQLASR